MFALPLELEVVVDEPADLLLELLHVGPLPGPGPQRRLPVLHHPDAGGAAAALLLVAAGLVPLPGGAGSGGADAEGEGEGGQIELVMVRSRWMRGGWLLLLLLDECGHLRFKLKNQDRAEHSLSKLQRSKVGSR